MALGKKTRPSIVWTQSPSCHVSGMKKRIFKKKYSEMTVFTEHLDLVTHLSPSCGYPVFSGSFSGVVEFDFYHFAILSLLLPFSFEVSTYCIMVHV